MSGQIRERQRHIRRQCLCLRHIRLGLPMGLPTLPTPLLRSYEMKVLLLVLFLRPHQQLCQGACGPLLHYHRRPNGFIAGEISQRAGSVRQHCSSLAIDICTNDTTVVVPLAHAHAPPSAEVQ
jgi:hypothetical protein